MTDTIEAVARAIDPEVWAHDLPIPTRADTIAFHERRQRSNALARIAITAHTKALIVGAGELRCVKSVSLERDFGALLWTPYDQAAATIAAQKAEIERLTEREARAKLDGVRAGIEAAACAQPPTAQDPRESVHQRGRFDGIIEYAKAIGNLDAEAIARGLD